MTLARLATPSRLADHYLMFGWPLEWVSRISRKTQEYIYEKWKHLLYFDEQRLTPYKLEQYAAVIRRRNSPLENCWGFIDGTLRKIARPVYWQEAVLRTLFLTSLCTLPVLY